MPFDSILGQKVPISILRRMLKTDQIPHAFIFTGPKGIGKQTTASAFAKAMNCMEKEDNFCGRCLSCQKIDRLTHPDFFCLEPDKNVIKIEKIRALQQDIAFKPLEAIKRVIIIDQADKLNRSSANCLLKTLEEPPENTILILIVQSTTDMLPTVLSRCQKICFNPLSNDNILQLLCKKSIPENKAALAAQHANGSISRAVFLLESDFFLKRNKISETLSCLLPDDFERIIRLSELLSKKNNDFSIILEFLQTWHRDVLLLKEGIPPSLIYNKDLEKSVRMAAGHETRDGIINKINKIQWIQNNASFNIDMQLGLETVFMST